ncbi:hypothetical protein GALMADRAFT_145729 [Galerina marginata CBS 339.88]|uniref:F-box domain-containing protein n=1 Tax=Galerina marginata (strain CBS 339.88) TaxID=685588 RepID=A0A067SRD2_GALM3|nr:hypothetical protein GALMADRAFT_145729 [Galerina marginata CBS 339.88]
MDRPTDHTKIIPVEVWWECFILLRASEHKILSLTCHHFHNICLDFIFKSITYRSQINFSKADSFTWMTGQLDKLHDHIGRFRNIAKDPRQAVLVRRCSLVHSLELDSDVDILVSESAKAAYDTYVQAFVKSVSAFINLREVFIDFQDQTISRRVLKALAVAAPPHLDQVLFINFRIGIHRLEPRLKPRRVIVHNADQYCNLLPGPSSSDILDIFSGKHLEHLEVLSLPYPSRIFAALTNQGKSTHLVSLSFCLEPRKFDVLYRFLATCPNLNDVRIDLSEYEFHKLRTLPRLPRSVIPCLRVFHGPDRIAMLFIPGRPVQEVSLSQNQQKPLKLEPVLKRIFLSTVPVIRLAVPDYTDEDLTLICANFPDLKTLSLGLPYQILGSTLDPKQIRLEAVAGEVAKSENTAALDRQSEKYYYSAPTLHSAYMNFVHWIAHGMVNLPPNLETLHLNADMCSSLRHWDYSCSSDNDDSIKMYGYGYSLSLSIFQAVSSRYSSLQTVSVGQGKEEFRWLRGAGGKWACCREVDPA